MSRVRREIVRGLIALSMLVASTVPVQAGPAYSQIVAFGDSLSDTGNDYILYGQPTAPYYQGRFSNGPVWLDYLAAKLGVPDPQPSLAGGTNYAYGGATATALTTYVPDLGQQVQSYLQKSPKADPNALYTVLMGANDFFGGITNAATVANAVDAALVTLINAGAKNVLVGYLPPQGITPEYISLGSQAQAQINALDAQFNADLAADVAALKSANPGVGINTFDLYAQSNQVLRDPGAYGFTDVTDEGINAPPGTNLSQYLFWDDVHPTTVGHSYIAAAAYAAIVPEPGGLTLAAVCGAALLAGVRRRKCAG